MEVSAVVRLRTVSAAAALAAAVAVWAVVRRDRRLRRQLARERVEHRLTDGCLIRDLDAFRRRLDGLVAPRAPADDVVLARDEALVRPTRIDPTTDDD
ncbi:hypothetical protein GCM10022206_52990 [Streptomyces chiangmaiensis]